MAVTDSFSCRLLFFCPRQNTVSTMELPAGENHQWLNMHMSQCTKEMRTPAWSSGLTLGISEHSTDSSRPHRCKFTASCRAPHTIPSLPPVVSVVLPKKIPYSPNQPQFQILVTLSAGPHLSTPICCHKLQSQ